MLQWKVYHRHIDSKSFIESAQELVYGVDPGPVKSGIALWASIRNVRCLLWFGSVGLTERTGNTLRDITQFSDLCLPLAFLMNDTEKTKTSVRIERQNRMRDGIVKDENDMVAAAIACAARNQGFADVELVPASVKLSNPMLRLLDTSIKNSTEIPKGAKNRIARKKIGVRVLREYLIRTSQNAAKQCLDDVKPAADAYDPVDAALTAMTKWRDTNVTGQKRKRKE